ncbi:MAG: holo-ACP synthase [Candidatus Omnitrophica bacterium]|nr:holo-ACP synthase [Candidatus Omnitrophota bacterium]MBU1871909.1 holo-ACP synthase [Candidatus Omnitrophota bacterium]
MGLIGNGVDIIEVKRIKGAVEKYGKIFLKRIFTDKELECVKQHNNSYQHMAGRFAAKEAVFKALGKATLNFQDVEILNDSQGKPYCSLINLKNKVDIYISISHIKNYAVASAIITEKACGS